MTTFTAAEIQAQGIQDIKGISDYTPDLRLDPVGFLLSCDVNRMFSFDPPRAEA